MKSSPLLLVSLFSAMITGGNAQAPEGPTPQATRTTVPGTSGPLVQSAEVAVVIRSLAADSKVTGLIGFFSSGDAVSAHGDIGGLEPNRRYRVVVKRAVAASDETAERQPPTADSTTAGPDPALPSPAGARTEISPDKSTRELGVLTSDAKGLIHISTLLREAMLREGPTTVLNGTVSVWREPAGTSESVQVASGVIEVVEKPAIQVPTPEE